MEGDMRFMLPSGLRASSKKRGFHRFLTTSSRRNWARYCRIGALRPMILRFSMIPSNKRLAVSHPADGFALRVYHKKGQRKKMPRITIKCGCCDTKVEIYHADDSLEINGVMASVENWREILLPLLHAEPAKKSKE